MLQYFLNPSLSQRYIVEFVYGAIDGTITTFAIMAGAMGASLSPGVVLVLGIANVLADGFSMASGNYLSEKSGEAVDALHADSSHKREPMKTAMITFVSFVVVGMIPLLSFIFALVNDFFQEHAFSISIVLTGIAFILIGMVRGRVTKQNVFRTSFETLLVGSIAAAISFIVGYLLRGLAGV